MTAKVKFSGNKLIVLTLMLFLCSACSSPAEKEIQPSPSATADTSSQLAENVVSKLKERPEFSDNEVLNINKRTFAQRHPMNGVMIIPLDDEGKSDLAFYIEHSMHLSFDGPPHFDMFGKEDGLYFSDVENFIAETNAKYINGVVLNNFIMKDLVLTLEFSDGSKVVFDKYYADIVDDSDTYIKYFEIE